MSPAQNTLSIGGAIASLRNDPRGKGYAGLLLSCPTPIPESMAENL